MEDTGGRSGGFALIVGGSGYLGLHLLEGLSGANSPFKLAFTYHSHPPPPFLLDKLEGVLAFKVELVSGEGLDAVATAIGLPQVIINCAAVSVPRECEEDPSLAMAVNCPSALVQWLHSFGGQQSSLLIHLSTDQVYEGSRSYYKEIDETKPVNAYGKSKVAAEQFIYTHCSKFAILRSSIMYGPQPLVPVQKSLPIQWINNVLSNGKEAEFFYDEYRCPVFVKDVVKAIQLLMAKEASGASTLQMVLNLGGPNRLSRSEMAEVVADVRGYNKSLVKHVSAASVNRGVASPSDISMDVSRLISTLGIVLTPFRLGVELTLTCTSC